MMFAVVLVLAMMALVSADQEGCAYYDSALGDVYGLCDITGTNDNPPSLCSYGCHKNQCWKQCVGDNEEKNCVIETRAFALAVDSKGLKVTCQNDRHEDCLENIDFTKKGSRCIYSDPNW